MDIVFSFPFKEHITFYIKKLDEKAMKIFELECLGDDKVLEIDHINPDEYVKIDIYNHDNQSLTLHFKQTDVNELSIENLEIITPNFSNLKFKLSQHALNIKNLVLKCAGILYQGGAKVQNLFIFSDRPEVSLTSIEDKPGQELAENIRIIKVEHEDDTAVSKLLSGVNVIPGSGEFVLDPEKSYLGGAARTLTELKSCIPGAKWISPVVSWFADSLDIANCKILPGKQTDFIHKNLNEWKVGEYGRDNAHPILTDELGKTNYGGSINDDSVIKFLDTAKQHGLNVIFYPLIMVDTKGKPWRGHITGKPEDVEIFFEKYYRPFITHYATLVKGKVDAFIIGSELVKLTSIYKFDQTTKEKTFPFIEKLICLAKEVKLILGDQVKITYAADWSEYHSAHGGLRPLDTLWANPAIDFVGIDAYFPLTNSQKSRITLAEIKSGWNSGEGIDFYMDNGEKKAFSKDEGYNQWKNLAYWWHSEHWAWDNDKGQSVKSPWQPKMKPIWFTEFGFPSIDKSTNKPNVFYDPKSQDGGVPTYSSGKIDYAIQRTALRATLEYWQNSEFVKNMIAWCWDARGVGWNGQYDYFADSRLWATGHWIDGKIGFESGLRVSGKVNCQNFSVEAKYVDLACSELSVKDDLTLNVYRDLLISFPHLHAKHIVLKSGGIVDINSENVTGDSLIIEALTLNFKDTKFALKELTSFNIYGHINGYSVVTEESESYSKGTKDHVTEVTQTVSRPIFETEKLYIFAMGGFAIEAAIIKSKNVTILVKDLILKNIITDFIKVEDFKSSKNGPFGVGHSSTTTNKSQTANFVTIETESLDIRVTEVFRAVASVISAQDLNLVAKDYQMSGVALQNSVDNIARKKMIHKSSTVAQTSGDVSIAGVRITAKDVAYLFADNQIWLAATTIVSDNLNVTAKKISLNALVGGSFESLKIVKKGVKTFIKSGDGEYSISQGLAKSIHGRVEMHDQAYRSGLVGMQQLSIKTGELEQSGGLLAGKHCKIFAEKWHNNAVVLHHRLSEVKTEMSIGVGIGIRENISGTIKGLENTASSVNSLDGDNPYAGINLVASIYGNITDIANILSGNIVGVGVKASISGSYYKSQQHLTTYQPNLVQAETLEVNVGGEITGSLKIEAKEQNIKASKVELYTPEDKMKSSTIAVSASIDSSGGYSGQVFSEKNGKSFGVGYSGSFGGSGQGVIGNKLSVSYKDGKKELDVQYTDVNWQKFDEIVRNSSFKDRVIANLTTEIGKLSGYATDPTSIVTELKQQFEQLTSKRGNPDQIMSGVASGEGLEEEEDAVVLLNDINITTKISEAKYCIIFLYDPTIETDNNNVQKLKLSDKRIGHYYVGPGAIVNGTCVKNKLYGMNPAKEGMPIAPGTIKDEAERYLLAKKYEKQSSTKILIEKAIPIDEKQLAVFKNFIDNKIGKPDNYIGHSSDCISFVNDVLEVIGLKGVRITDIIKPSEITRISLAQTSAWLRSLDNKIEKEFSQEAVAKKYGIPRDRIVQIGVDQITHMQLFKITPYDEYSKSKDN